MDDNLKSVQSQGIDEIEHIIIDGGSEDESIEVLKRSASDLSYWVSEKDNGQSHAINKGIEKSTGKIINWLNSDDYYEQGALQIVQDAFQSPEVNCFCGRSIKRKVDGESTLSKGTDIFWGNLAKTIGWARIDQPETFFTRSTWEKVGPLNENLHYTMDREWWMRYLYEFGLNRIKTSQDILVNFRLHEDSKTSSQTENFDIEHNTLFYILANAAKSSRIARLIAELNKIDRSINSTIARWTRYELMQECLDYYLLKKADECYYANDKTAAKAYLAEIRQSSLQNKDKKLYQRLKAKVKLPLSVIHFFRK